MIEARRNDYDIVPPMN